ncbi:PorP/SprF family type IX secretion system membrane protein [Pseudozobellia thermophila]|uniref:Type IX secretion system membrane protein, PorP/SprF family n=1 Tax=Pseudozobellia thermophila TaxID=192903 RepID=A0A1M6BIF4_9FLAO|nr:type IX secretion system membrane protein PorP/SprF [Pseudozobellia thermophila]SHI48368.1 type IX secretion system membrane protein, PorP/SprF family [Pseudozobellia thermophila]
MKLAKYLALTLIAAFSFTNIQAQEDDPILLYSPASQNLLKFNRFLINPTFSTVQEDKSYINLLHRNQSVQFKDNDQTYFLSYSGRIGDRSGLGLSLYTQSIGPVSNIGVLANYAYGVKLSEKSNFTFGGNLAYYSTGLDRNSVDVIDTEDYRLNGTEDSNVLSFQPGFNISYGNFDFGVFAENLFDYNLKTSESLTDFADKTYSAHLQYTHAFDNDSGIMEGSRLMPLARVRMNGQNRYVSVDSDDSQDITFGGSLILDLPKLGWLQGGYDSFYGASAGAGFNINKRLSLGYTMEKGFTTDLEALGVTHEISFAYSFTPNLTEDRVMLEEDYEDELVESEDLDKNELATNEEIAELKRKLAENDAIIEELMFRQDSIEANRQRDLERRFNMVMRMVRNETKGERPDLEEQAEKMFLGKLEKPTVASNGSGKDTYIPNGTNGAESQDKALATTVETPRPTIAQDKVQNTSKRPGSVGQDKVKSRKFRNLEGVQDGYYVVANVYKGGKYMEKFINDMDAKGFATDYIDNPKNGLKYVYLKRYDTWQEAADAHASNMNGSYDGDLWIMNVDNKYTNEAYASNVDKLKEKSAKYDNNVLRQNVVVKDQIATKELTSKTYNIDGVGSGYYIIANVFANPKNANRFVKLLNSYGLSASYFINPENNWRYVYLKRHESWNNALISYYNHLNNSYDDKMWIMRVKPNQLA